MAASPSGPDAGAAGAPSISGWGIVASCARRLAADGGWSIWEPTSACVGVVEIGRWPESRLTAHRLESLGTVAPPIPDP